MVKMSGNEVSGKKNASLNVSQLSASTENSDVFCHPCDESDKRVEARGFCNDCQKYLCSKCVEFHKKFWVTKKHVIQDKDSMPRDAKPVLPVEQTKDVCTEPCAKHPGKILEYYCASHDELGCSVWATLGHITCGLGYIPELSKGTTNSNEYGEMLKKINVLQKQFEETKEKSEESIIKIENKGKAFTDELTQLGEEIIEHVRSLVQKAMDEKDESVKEMPTGLRSSKDQTEEIIEEINDMKLHLEHKKDSDNESFVLMKVIKLKMKKLEVTLEKTQIGSKPTIFQFAENPDMKCVTEIKSLGTLFKQKNKFVEQLDNIKISTQNDVVIPHINGLQVLCDGTLAIVDRGNKSVKVYTPGGIVSEINVKNKPWDLTEVSKGQLAVTLPQEGKIQLLTVAEGLYLESVIETKKGCMGIAAYKDKLFVSFNGNPAYVEILKMDGGVLKRIIKGPNGENLFNCPLYVTVNPDINMVFLSDSLQAIVTSMNLDGEEVTSLYRDELSHGLTIGENGSIYICDRNSVQHITSEGTNIQTLLDQRQERVHSLCIAYDKNLKRLYLGGQSKSLRVYQLL